MIRLLLMLTLSLVTACTTQPLDLMTNEASQKVHPTLAAHSQIFNKRVEKVTDGVYVAIGYALANSIMLEGDDGLVIVDVTESVESGRAVMAAFREISSKPIKALIYTHNHADHVFGGIGYFPEGAPADLPVYAHESTNYYINRFANIIQPTILRRSTRMFGTLLPEGEEGVVNAGIGPYLAQGGHSGGTVGLLRPNRTFRDRLAFTVAGIDIELIHAPGETNDQLFVWLPQKRVLLPGDNIYQAFPNLYTIRGTLYRDVLEWAYSLDKMRDLKPEHLVPSHTVPVSGEAEVAALLRDYRDAIQYVHDQTIRGMNQGKTPDELVESVQLPPHLKNHPWLLEHYGRVSWSVRNIYNGYLGWFNGEAETLTPLSPATRAESLVRLAGGSEAMLTEAESALQSGRYQWAAELASYLLHAGVAEAQARAIKAEAFTRLGYASQNPNGRHYYLTQAGELAGVHEIKPIAIGGDKLALARSLPITDVLSALPVNLDAEKSIDTDRVVNFHFTNTDERYFVHVRRGVAEVRQGQYPGEALQVTTTTQVLTEVLVQARGVPGALASGDLKLERGLRDVPSFVSFLLLFKD
jgi:alkyl sulfatase BDS1-like metallo-beta-lactamase superfamily hydrolase